MGGIWAGVFGAIGTLAVFSFFAFAVWIDYRKKKDEREAAHLERMKALELGHVLPDAEIARANAYARAYTNAAWAAGLIGLLVPIVVALLVAGGTVLAVLHREPFENITTPLIVAWSIAGIIMLAAILRSLKVIRQLPRLPEDIQTRVAVRDGHPDSSPADVQKEHIEL